jgi:uncharacterized membrane protein (UPF0127 family)
VSAGIWSQGFSEVCGIRLQISDFRFQISDFSQVFSMKFLDPLDTLSDPTLVNAQTGTVIASSVEVARTSAARRQGLLGREGLPAGSALVITRCNAIHTMGMQFAIDVAFVDADGCVRKIVHRLRPRRIAIAPRASTVIELAAGQLDPGCLSVGDRVYLAPRSGAVPVAGTAEVSERGPSARQMTAASVMARLG